MAHFQNNLNFYIILYIFSYIIFWSRLPIFIAASKIQLQVTLITFISWTEFRFNLTRSTLFMSDIILDKPNEVFILYTGVTFTNISRPKCNDIFLENKTYKQRISS